MRMTAGRRMAATVATAALLFGVGCAKEEAVSTSAEATTAPATASSNDSPGSTPGAEICTLIEELDRTNPEDVEAALDVLDEIRAVVPDDEAADWDVVIDINEQYLGLDEDQNYELGAELVDDPDFADAAADLNEFSRDECDEDLVLLIPYGSDRRTAPLDDPIFDDPPSGGDDPTSIDSLQAHLEKEYGTETWWPALDGATTWSSSGFSDSVDWSVTLSGSDAAALTASDLESACEAMAQYLDTYEDRGVAVEILDADETVLVSRSAGEACAAA